MKKQQIIKIVLLTFVFFSLTSCAPEAYSSHEYGFFGGLWHGFILVFSLIGKLFGGDIGIYADHNSGFFYWLGFIIGIGGLGGGAASRRWYKHIKNSPLIFAGLLDTSLFYGGVVIIGVISIITIEFIPFYNKKIIKY